MCALLVVCGQAKAVANTPPDIPPGILYPSAPVPPIVGTPAGPAPVVGQRSPLPSPEPTGRKLQLARQLSAEIELRSNSSKPLSTQASENDGVVHPQASCNAIGGVNPLYNPVPPSQTTCALVVNLRDGLNQRTCTATFIRPNMVVTAGNCLVTDAMQYNIDPADPGISWRGAFAVM
jgi:hypothetical protein